MKVHVGRRTREIVFAVIVGWVFPQSNVGNIYYDKWKFWQLLISQTAKFHVKENVSNFIQIIVQNFWSGVTYTAQFFSHAEEISSQFTQNKHMMFILLQCEWHISPSPLAWQLLQAVLIFNHSL